MLGQRLGPYLIQSELGSGGMGTVYLAQVQEDTGQAEAGAEVALKVLHSSLMQEHGVFRRFLREAKLTREIEHPNVVRGLDAGKLKTDDGKTITYLVMECVQGQTLRSLLTELGRVPEELCRHIGLEVARGLQAIHAAGAIHRDLKPENVVITADQSIKIMDLGVARIMDEAIRLSQSGSFAGTVMYAAPELFHGKSADIDARADLYALGLTMYELGTGENPFSHIEVAKVVQQQIKDDPARAATLNSQLSPFFEELVHTLIEKDRKKRVASADDLAEILDQGEDGAWWTARAAAIRSATRQPLRRCTIRRQTAVYGRDAELQRLYEVYAAADLGEGQVVLIEGEAGIGKTRLVDEFVGMLQREGRDVNFLFGANPPGGRATAPGAFANAFREHFVSAGLEDTLRAYLPDSPVLIPAFAALLRGDPAAPGDERLTKQSLETVFVQATRALAAERTTVILIDDLHFAPVEGRGLFAALTLAISRHRVLLVGTLRHNVARAWVAGINRAAHTSHMELDRLTHREVGKVLVDALRSRALANMLAPRIAERSDGNPFFLFEILRGLREGKALERQADGSWTQTTEIIPEISIPATVRELIEGQLAGLQGDDAKVLKVASCCGYEFDPHLIGHVLSMRDVAVLKVLGRMERSMRLVRSLGRNFVFDHHQVQAVLYEALEGRVRRRIHSALGHALERREGTLDTDVADLDGALCVQLCRHFQEGGQGERALRYLRRSLEHLGEACRHDESVAIVDELLAEEGLLEGPQRAEVLLGQVGPLDVLGLRKRQRKALDEALRLADATDDTLLQARVRTSLGWLFFNQSRHARACGVLVDAVDLAAEAGDLNVEIRARGNLGNAFLALGRFDDAHEQHERRLASARKIDDKRSEAAATGNLGQVFYARGSYEAANELHRRDLELSRGIGYRLGEAIATANLGTVLFALGRPREASDTFRISLTVAREIGFRRGETIARSHLAEILVSMGELHGARDHLDSARSLAKEIEFGALHGEILRQSGDLMILAGATDRAEQAYRAALAKLRDIPAPPRVARTLLALGKLFASSGRPDAAAEALEEARELAVELDTPNETVLASVHLARLPMGNVGEATEAFAKLASRMAHLAKMEARLALWRVTDDMTHLSEAVHLLEHLRGHANPVYREKMVRGVPLYRDIASAWREHGE